MQRLIFNSQGTGGIYYLLHTPETQKDTVGAPPMLVFLHGSEERGRDYDRIMVHGLPKYIAAGREIPAVVLCPQCPEGITWTNIAGDIRELILRTAEDTGADTARISLTGISMGGFGTWDIATNYPELFRRIAPICGGGMSWRADALRAIPVRAFHGALDEAVPLAYSELMVDAVNAAGGNAELTVFPGVGHNAWDKAYLETDVIEWLLK